MKHSNDFPLERMNAAAIAWVLACLISPKAFADAAQLVTQSGHTLGLNLSGYKYDEPSILTIKAAHIGLEYSGTYAWGGTWPRSNEGWFVRGNLTLTGGKADYNSPISGSLNDKTNWYIDTKGLIGRDVDMGRYVLAPHFGLGYRRLFNDLRGTSSTGGKGYRRTSVYTYLPMGLTHRTKLDDQSQLNTTLEYMHLLGGRQQATFSDVSPAFSDLSMKQRRGHGIHVRVMNQRNHWSWGPTLTYWNLKVSEASGTPAYVEPKNNTYEFGLIANYHF